MSLSVLQLLAAVAAVITLIGVIIYRRIVKSSVPWAEPRSVTAYGAQPGHQRVWLVSRHAIAETGLICPACGAEVCLQGRFDLVRRMMIDGRENEVVICAHTVEYDDGRKRVCGAILAASPDTEHGDHLLAASDLPEFYKFRRTSLLTALQQKYGNDVVAGDETEVLISHQGAHHATPHLGPETRNP